ncbi:MAG TPA: sodium/glutamate symporter [Alcaligenes sp.]|nr:sodium/glutamate symporter [Alcaligenes sp.]HRL26979.1 sodium/glutamate symporter [Alcaligenes sp.]
MNIELDIAQTVGMAAVFLVLGEYIKNRVAILARYFIPSPIIGGLVFSLIALLGHQTGAFTFQFNDDIRNFLLMAFFTTIGFSASFELLKKGGLAVGLFLGCAVALIILQNVVGVSLAMLLGANPLIGLAAGSVAMTGGHGTSAAFGPVMEAAGATGALPAAIAASTWGLVMGCVIGGPVGLRLMKRHGITGPAPHRRHRRQHEGKDTAPAMHTETIQVDDSGFDMPVYAVVLLSVAIGAGSLIINWMADQGIILPAYLGSMLVAAIMRNIIDWRRYRLPEREFEIIGNVSLAFFLVMALMVMKLWQLADVAGPLLLILVAQTILMFTFAYFITFRVMGRDYDAVVMSAGHCGFGMGATPNAMANMQAFTEDNGPSYKAFFVIPLVGSLFIDFFNAVIITGFMNVLN